MIQAMTEFFEWKLMMGKQVRGVFFLKIASKTKKIFPIESESQKVP